MPSLLGKVNLGLNGLTPSNLWYPLLNAWKMSDELIVISSTAPIDGNLRSDIAPGVLNESGQESAWRRLDGTVYLTAEGELINPLPADATHFIRRFQTISTNILPNSFLRTGEPWVLKFDGVSTTITIALDNVVRVGNKITGTWQAGGAASRQVQFGGIDHNNPPVNIRFCPAAWESLLDAGEIFNPAWMSEVRRGSGITRFMDWQVTNNNRSTRTFADIPTESFYKYGGGTGSSPGTSTYLKAGMPVSVMSKLARKCNSHPWVNIPHVFGTPKTAKFTAITQANPPVVTSANHPFVNGDQVIPYVFGGMTQSSTVTMTIASPCVVTWTSHPLQASNGVRFSSTGALPTGLTAGNTYYVVGASITANTFQISATPGGAAINTTGSQSGTHTGTTEIVRNTFTVANVTTDTFELAGVNATGFSAFGSSLGWLTSPYSLAGMTTEMTLLATHFRDNVQAPLLTYFEFSNEAWNAIFDAFHWLAAQARAKFPNDNSYRMTGYLLAHCMKTVRDTYGVDSRTRWKGVAATFSIGDDVSNEIITGINTYIAENAPSLVLTDLIDALAVVGYWSGNIEDNNTPGAVTINIGTSTFTKSGHDYLEGNPLKFTTTGTLPTPVVVGTFFYAKNVVPGATFQISATSGGAVLTLGGSQSGTHTVNRVHGDLSQEWLDDSISRFEGGLEATRYAYFDRTVNDDLFDGRYSGCRFSIVNSEAILWVPNKAVADANGLDFIQYEGGNSNALADGGHSADSEWRAAFPETTQNAADGANYTHMVDAWTALGGTYPAKFTEANPVNVFGAFGALRYPGDSNPTWEAVCTFNDKLFCGRLR